MEPISYQEVKDILACFQLKTSKIATTDSNLLAKTLLTLMCNKC